MGYLLKLLALTALTVSIGLGSNAMASERFGPFVKDQYYVVTGGKEVSPKDFAANPLKFMRSTAAYTALRDHVSQVVGRPIDDQAFRALIVSNDVQLVACAGNLKTQGFKKDGTVHWHQRACYKGERLMQVKVPGGWMNLLSLGCYNPVEGERPILPPPAPTPVIAVCGSNAARFKATESSWPANGKFCAVGEQSSPNILFPVVGSTSNWSCVPPGGTAKYCQASREEPVPQPEVSVPAEACELVQFEEPLPTPPTYVGVPPLTVSVCGHYIMSAGGFWRVHHTRHVNVTVQRVCTTR